MKSFPLLGSSTLSYPERGEIKQTGRVENQDKLEISQETEMLGETRQKHSERRDRG